MSAISFLEEAATPRPHNAGRTRVVVAYGILWSERSARIDGTLAVALQQGSSGAGKALLDLLIEAGVKTTREVPRWLLRNRGIVLRILAA